jgi:hypothetical protein
MAYTFLKARGLDVGKSLVEPELLDAARDTERRAKDRNLQLELPVDHVVAPSIDAEDQAEVLAIEDSASAARSALPSGGPPQRGGRVGDPGCRRRRTSPPAPTQPLFRGTTNTDGRDATRP